MFKIARPRRLRGLGIAPALSYDFHKKCSKSLGLAAFLGLGIAPEFIYDFHKKCSKSLGLAAYAASASLPHLVNIFA